MQDDQRLRYGRPRSVQAQAAALTLAALLAGCGEPKRTSAIPDGTYTTTTTVADFRHGRQFGADWNRDVTWTFRLRDGRIRETQAPDYPDQGPCSGRYDVTGTHVTFTWKQTGGCVGVLPEELRWSYLDGRLSFRIVDVTDSASRVIYTAHPWRRIR